MKEKNKITFALDIGTRTVIGLILKKQDKGYEILDSEVIEHDKRAMLDGQIHNVYEVSKIVKEIKNRLEKRIDYDLKKVSIAAAGRALETVTTEYKVDFEKKRYIEDSDVKNLEYAAIQKAQKSLAQSDPDNSASAYHFVGYSVIEYLLDGMFLQDLIGQKGSKISVKLITTFLPQVVIDSLLSVIHRANLEVEHLTLEPIAAANMVIPKEMYNFNLALVDIGAGTSDVAITKGGSMIGYAMVPVAGDEITESLAEEYMLEYNSAEKVKKNLSEKDFFKAKNILGSEIKIDSAKALSVINPQVKNMVKMISEKIIEINQKAPQAVMCIGGGSLTPDLKEELIKKLELSSERVGIRDGSNLENIDGYIKNLNGTQSLTPIGIAVTADESKSEAIFADVEVNGQNVQIFSLNNPTISDALLTKEINIKKLQPKPGMGITCTVNGELKTIRGTMGKSGELYLNGEKAELEDKITSGDIIEFKEAQKGEDAKAKISDVIEDDVEKEYEIIINGNKTTVSSKIYQNGKLVSASTELKDRSEIKYEKIETIKDALVNLLEIPEEMISDNKHEFFVNEKKIEIPEKRYFAKILNANLNLDDKMRDGMKIKLIENENEIVTISDLLNEYELKNESETLDIVFNGSSLQLPAKNQIVKCNGEKVDRDYKISNGDKIKIEMKSMTVDQVFKYINYNISDSMKEDMELLINDELADYNDIVNSGDNIKMKIRRRGR